MGLAALFSPLVEGGEWVRLGQSFGEQDVGSRFAKAAVATARTKQNMRVGLILLLSEPWHVRPLPGLRDKLGHSGQKHFKTARIKEYTLIPILLVESPLKFLFKPCLPHVRHGNSECSKSRATSMV